MILNPGEKLEAILAGAVSANQPEVHVSYLDYGTSAAQFPLETRTALNSANDVTILAACTVGQTKSREILGVSIYNKDTAAVTVTVKTDDGTTERIKNKTTLATTESLCYEHGEGWYVLTASGAKKLGAGVSGPTSSTDNAVARWDGTTGTVIQNSLFVVDDSGQVTSFGGNIQFPATQAASAGANVFDDYEEGTWTPVLTFGTPGDLSVAYSTQVGSYTKIGNLVRLSMNIATSSFTFTTASGNCNITGVPFAAANVTSNLHNGSVRWAGITKANYTSIVSNLGASSSTLDFIASGSAQGESQLAAADMPTAGAVRLRGTITYQADT